ncbi:MAG: hypothetical protein AB1305_04720 [Candidatus Hadarchaeota archaeon]
MKKVSKIKVLKMKIRDLGRFNIFIITVAIVYLVGDILLFGWALELYSLGQVDRYLSIVGIVMTTLSMALAFSTIVLQSKQQKNQLLEIENKLTKLDEVNKKLDKLLKPKKRKS